MIKLEITEEELDVIRLALIYKSYAFDKKIDDLREELKNQEKSRSDIDELIEKITECKEVVNEKN